MESRNGGDNQAAVGITRGQPQRVSDWTSTSACVAAGRARGTNNGNQNSTRVWSRLRSLLRLGRRTVGIEVGKQKKEWRWGISAGFTEQVQV